MGYPDSEADLACFESTAAMAVEPSTHSFEIVSIPTPPETVEGQTSALKGLHGSRCDTEEFGEIFLCEQGRSRIVCRRAWQSFRGGHIHGPTVAFPISRALRGAGVDSSMVGSDTTGVLSAHTPSRQRTRVKRVSWSFRFIRRPLCRSRLGSLAAGIFLSAKGSFQPAASCASNPVPTAMMVPAVFGRTENHACACSGVTSSR